MTSLSEEKINKSLEEIYLQDNNKIIKWLDEIKKPENQKDGKIPGLFMKSLTKIKTDGEVYNLILQWIKDNRDKFADYDFTGVPDSTFVSLDNSNVIRKYQLRSWIPIDILKKYNISKNPNAVDYLKDYRDLIKWNYLSANPNAIELLREKAEEENKMERFDLSRMADYKKLDWKNLSANPGTVELLKQYRRNIKWDRLSENTNLEAIELLKEKIEKESKMKESQLEKLKDEDKIDWNQLCLNAGAIEIIKANPKKINWQYLSKNPNPEAIELLKNKVEEENKMTGRKLINVFKERYIDWDVLSLNPAAIEILEENPKNILWKHLSENKNAVELLKKYPDNIDWNGLSLNPNPAAIELLEKNLAKINWIELSANPGAIELLEKYSDSDKIVWKILIEENPNIFELVEVKNKTFETLEDIKRWCKDPEIHPLNGNEMPAMSRAYYDIYVKAYKIMKKNGTFSQKDITGLFPKNHLLFGDIDLMYYTCIEKNDPPTYFNICKYNNSSGSILYELLTEKMEFFDNEDTVLDTEIEILRNRFSDRYGKHAQSNMETIYELIDAYKNDMVNSFLDTNYISAYDYPDRINKIKLINLKAYWFINFLEYNKMATGETVLEYLMENNDEFDSDNEWTTPIDIYNNYKAIIDDIDDCFNPESGIIENFGYKKLTPIDDPLDKYFEVYEKQLAEIRKPIYSQLIDLTTFKPKENVKFLNNAQFAEFKKERDKYDRAWKRYSDRQTLYETTRQGSSPKPPEKPTITLPWGTEHTIAKQIDPIHIRDEVVAKFREEYAKAQPIIDEYNRVKNMSYKALKKHIGESSSSSEKRMTEGNELLSMTREDIANNVLYDYTGRAAHAELADKCSESIDILTNEELDDENYPLSKLQLMARMKVYTRNKKNYRTECIYAPKLYNYLIQCINSNEPFINPVTKAKYTQENIEELMKVMRIINPKIEVPVFMKHSNDTKLELKYNTVAVNISDYGSNPSYGSTRILNFNRIYLSRTIAGSNYIVYEICHMPADIEVSGTFSTGSTDLTSNTMIVNIYKLFNEGRLLHNYLPPYNIRRPGTTNQYTYIKPQIHFNRILSLNNWLYVSDSDKTLITKEEFINRFKHYAQEVNNYTF
jgi:hypothetical protein